MEPVTVSKKVWIVETSFKFTITTIYKTFKINKSSRVCDITILRNIQKYKTFCQILIWKVIFIWREILKQKQTRIRLALNIGFYHLNNDGVVTKP